MNTNNLTYSFVKLRDKLHRSAMRFLRNDEDAQDALQDTFSRLWESEPIESEIEARNKLFLVLRNICIDRLRKPPSVPLTETDIDNSAVEPKFSENMDNFKTLLTVGLSPTQKKIYDLIVNEDMDYQEVAAKLSMTVEAVRTNMSRARTKIRENYQKINR